MTTTPHDIGLPPNHHADHPGFSGVAGLIAALTFTVGRTGDADLAIRLTGTGAGDDVVDVGCGAGVAVRRAAARGASTVVGVDPSTEMLRVARATVRASRRFGELRGAEATVDFAQGTAEDLPLPDGAASVVWSLATVHHWRDLGAGLAEVRRVLRPGGRFLVIERHSPPGAKGNASHGWTDDQAERFAEMCRDAGFTGVEVGEHRHGRREVLTVLAGEP